MSMMDTLKAKLTESRRAQKAGELSTPSQVVPADPATLAAELASLTRPGITTDGLRRCPALLSLSLVAAKSASSSDSDLAVGASIVVREATVSVDEGNNGPTGILLGLVAGTRGMLLKDRRLQAAQALSVSTEHFRKDREDDPQRT